MTHDDAISVVLITVSAILVALLGYVNLVRRG